MEAQINDFFQAMRSPSAAFKLILLLEASFLYPVLGFWKNHKISAQDQGQKDAFWKISTMLAEILVMGGLLGLASFAAREKALFDVAELERINLNAHTELSKSLNALRDIHCQSPPRSLRPEPAVAANYTFCQIIRMPEFATDHELTWQDMKKRLEAFDRDNAQKSRSTQSYADMAAGLIDLLDKSLHAAKKLNSEKAKAGGPVSHASWLLVFIAFLMASLGVSIKIAKAMVEAAPSLDRYPTLKYWMHFMGWTILGYLLSIFWLSAGVFGYSAIILAFVAGVLLTQEWRRKFFGRSRRLHDYLVVGIAYLIATLFAFHIG